MVATAQYLNVAGMDLFSGILVSQSFDEGATWSDFEEQKGLAPIVDQEYMTVGCDATPMYHKKTDTVLLLGQTTEYKKGAMSSTGRYRHTFYSILDKRTNEFGPMRLLELPAGYERCGNGSGQSVDLENGDILIPVYYEKDNEPNFYSTVLRCSFDGEKISFLEMGKPLTIHICRGLCEPSLIFHNGTYYMTLRNDECGLVAKSSDGLNYRDLQLWKWDDGSILQNYNTQQHWMTVGGELYLVYTRRGADNDHVFRHRAPLFAAKVDGMRLVKNSEIAIVPEKGARLGNFGVTSYKEDCAVVMAAEWMQPLGCEKYGSDNHIYVAKISCE
jgi:hypothetical protein